MPSILPMLTDTEIVPKRDRLGLTGFHRGGSSIPQKRPTLEAIKQSLEQDGESYRVLSGLIELSTLFVLVGFLAPAPKTLN